MIVKLSFLVAPDWKAYVEVSFHMRSGNGMVPATDTPRQATEPQDAYICMGQDSEPDIKIIKVTPKMVLPDLKRKKKYSGWLEEGTR